MGGMSETGGEVPASYRMYQDTLNLFTGFLDNYHQKIYDTYGIRLRPEITYVPFVTSRKKLDLPTVGSDECGLFSMSLLNRDSESVVPSLRSHDFIRASLDLYKNGTSYVAAEDAAEEGVWYDLILSPEMRPIIVPSSAIEGDVTAETLETAHKYVLTDEECRELIDFLGQQEPSVSTMPFTEHDYTD
jgi:hypothetical protein